jgi:hypothetical protein
MIIFFNKKTGDIIGTVEGRIHDDTHQMMGMSISDSEEGDAGKIVCQWKVSALKTKEGNVITPEEANSLRENGQEVYIEHEPDHPQKDIFFLLDKEPIKVYEYKVDVATGKLVNK